MRIAFFSEMGSNIGTSFPRTFNNMRTDVAWSVALKAQTISLDSQLKFNSKFQPSSDGTCFDLGIIIVPKKSPEKAFKCFERERNYCKQWAVMQEANQTYWQNYSLNDQIGYLNLLSSVDVIFCHNEIDKRYYSGLIPNKKVVVLSSLMIEDAIPLEAKKVPHNRSSCIIGGNMVEWYGGMDSYIVAQEFKEQIYAPSMGRKQADEDNLEDIIYLPYMNWSEWIMNLNQFKYAVHLMRTYAAGTFPLNCAYLKIPCIGWGNGTDTQRLLFPELSPDEGDMETARKLAKHLKENEQFYNHCSEYAKKMYNEIYSERIFIDRFYKEFS